MHFTTRLNALDSVNNIKCSVWEFKIATGASKDARKTENVQHDTRCQPRAHTHTHTHSSLFNLMAMLSENVLCADVWICPVQHAPWHAHNYQTSFPNPLRQPAIPFIYNLGEYHFHEVHVSVKPTLHSATQPSCHPYIKAAAMWTMVTRTATDTERPTDDGGSGDDDVRRVGVCVHVLQWNEVVMNGASVTPVCFQSWFVEIRIMWKLRYDLSMSTVSKHY